MNVTSKIKKFLEKIAEGPVTWERAQRMLKVYKEAEKSVSGNAECRRIGRMKIVLEVFLDELMEEVERVEQESE